MQVYWEPKIITNSQMQTRYFDELLSGSIPAIVFPKVLNKKTCQDLTSKILSNNEMSLGLGSTQKIGESLNSYVSNKFEYFKKVKPSNILLRKIFSHDDPRKKMLAKISTSYGKNIQFAKEKSESYSNGMIRIHEPGISVHVHRDNASFEASDFSISKLSKQLSATLHLQSAEFGGNLLVFDKFWKKADEKFRVPEFGYSSDVVQEVSYASIHCEQGDLVIINPKKYHLVNTVRGKLERITLGFFFGEETKSNLSAWS